MSCSSACFWPAQPPPPTTLRRGLVSGEQLDLLVAECKKRQPHCYTQDVDGGEQCARALQEAAVRGVLCNPAGRAAARITNLHTWPRATIGYGGAWRGVLCVTGTVDVWAHSGCARESLTLRPGDCVCGIVELAIPLTDRTDNSPETPAVLQARGYVVMITEAGAKRDYP